jgi:hypothetical protein
MAENQTWELRDSIHLLVSAQVVVFTKENFPECITPQGLPDGDTRKYKKPFVSPEELADNFSEDDLLAAIDAKREMERERAEIDEKPIVLSIEKVILEETCMRHDIEENEVEENPYEYYNDECYFCFGKNSPCFAAGMSSEPRAYSRPGKEEKFPVKERNIKIRRRKRRGKQRLKLDLLS